MVKKIAVLLMFVGAGFLWTAPAEAQFQDDPGVSTCLGPGDPFCNPIDPLTGGSGGSSSCAHCAGKWSETLFTTFYKCCYGSCWLERLAGYSVTGKGASCELKDGNRECETKGDCSSTLIAVIDEDGPASDPPLSE